MSDTFRALDAQRAQAQVSSDSKLCCDACRSYTGSSFAEVTAQIESDSYLDLPRERVSLGRMFRTLRNQFVRDARRTLHLRQDLLPRFDKLIRPNGICLSGTWRITEESPYTGLFARGATALLVARASVGLTATETGAYRSFGMAGKLFPTDEESARVPTANFFLIDDNGGTRLRHYLDAEMTNAPRLSLNPAAIAKAPLLAMIALSQRLVDANAGERQLYPVAQVGVHDHALVRSPRFLRVRGAPGARVNTRDFRDQLRMEINGGSLSFILSVRDSTREPWRTLGSMSFTRAAASDSCDHRLHFPHPRWRTSQRSIG
jgi:hypothetical protein